MTTAVKTTLNRRNFLSTTATGAMAVAGIGAIGSNQVFAGVLPGGPTHSSMAYWTKARRERFLCSQIHLNKSQELSRIINSPNLDMAEKNLALRTTTCPSCNVQIRPGGKAAGYRIGV